MSGGGDRPELEPAIAAGPARRKTFWARLFELDDLSAHRGADNLADPPRPVPLSLAVFAWLNGRTFLLPLAPLAVIASVAAIAIDDGFAPLGEATTRLVAGGLVAVGLVAWAIHRRPIARLFATGLNQKPAVVETLEGLGGYTDSVRTAWSGWGYGTASYSGPVTVTVLELRAPDGQTARTKIRGLEYRGEQFLYDPAAPGRHLRVSRLGVRATPDEAGQWQVRAVGRSLLLAVLAAAALACAAGFAGVLIASGLG